MFPHLPVGSSFVIPSATISKSAVQRSLAPYRYRSSSWRKRYYPKLSRIANCSLLNPISSNPVYWRFLARHFLNFKYTVYTAIQNSRSKVPQLLCVVYKNGFTKKITGKKHEIKYFSTTQTHFFTFFYFFQWHLCDVRSLFEERNIHMACVAVLQYCTVLDFLNVYHHPNLRAL